MDHEIRPIEDSDTSAVADLIERYDTRNGQPGDFTEADLLQLLRRPLLDRALDTWLALHEGRPAAYGMLWHQDPNKVLLSFNGVDPDYTGRGLGSTLLDRSIRRAQDIAANLGKEIKLQNFVEVDDAAGMELVPARGFVEVRRQYSMVVDLDRTPAPKPFPEGIEVRPTGPEQYQVAHELVQDTFAEHWQHVYEPFEEWSKGLLARADHDPSLWWIAWAAEEPVGVLLGTVTDRMGWVEDLGVRKSWRGRGLGEALLHHAFDEFRRRGVPQAGLGVDAENATGAVRLYERVGMKPTHVYATFERIIQPA